MDTVFDPSIDYCSWWFEGNWANCCYIHDMTSTGSFDWTSHYVLMKCVSSSAGNYLVGAIMFLGLVIGGPLYDIYTKSRNRTNGRI